MKTRNRLTSSSARDYVANTTSCLSPRESVAGSQVCIKFIETIKKSGKIF
jgi:hypothetical protein